MLLLSTTESFSESFASEGSEFSSDSSELLSSESFENLSSDISTEYEDVEDNEDNRSVECIVISSDEESVPPSPSAPLTPGAQLELELNDWLDVCGRGQTETNHPSDSDSVMELRPSEAWNRQSFSDVELAGDLFSVFLDHIVFSLPAFCGGRGSC